MKTDGITGPDTTHQLGLGDIVSFLGATGKITKHEPGSWHGWDYEVTLEGGYTLLFTTEGYLHSFLKGAKLELVKKAERPKVKRWKWAYKATDGHLYVTRNRFSEAESKTSKVPGDTIQKIESTLEESDG